MPPMIGVSDHRPRNRGFAGGRRATPRALRLSISKFEIEERAGLGRPFPKPAEIECPARSLSGHHRPETSQETRGMATYSFVTIWRHRAPIDQVYDAIADSLAWPEWWPAVRNVEQVSSGDAATGVGDVRRYTFKGSLPYTLSFEMAVTAMERPRRLAGHATGELEGEGVWTLSEDAHGVTVARYDWNIRTTRWWMNLLAPLAGGVFKANHDIVMRSGAKGLCDRLGGVSGTCEWVSDREAA
jgi:uncharacterized protein YndB with AHSA1/START domain